jgi:colanic acid/amylovoran biosynthesis glycosyltransferase
VQFNIIGEGPLRQWLQGVIDQLHMRDHIHLLGCKNQQEIIDCLQDSHLFVAPSVTAPDGNQDAPINVLKEAMAMGLPVLSTRHGGIPELVEDGVSGFLVPEYDVDQLAEKLLFLIQHPSCWVEMGSAGRHCIESRFNLHKLNDELVTIYQHLLHPEQAKPLVSPSPTLYSVPLEATGS